MLSIFKMFYKYKLFLDCMFYINKTRTGENILKKLVIPLRLMI